MSSRKKQKKSQRAEEPLGSRSFANTGGSEPTEEELALATSLFGRNADIPSTSKTTSNPHQFTKTRAGESSIFDERTGLEDVEDEQLFALDTGSGAEADGSEASYSGSDDLSSSGSSAEEDDEADGEVQVLEESAAAGPSRQAPSPEPQSASQQRTPVWTDPSTSSMLIPLVGPNARAADGSFAGTKRLRKLRTSRDEMELSGKEYERRLREMYEKLHPRPSWASRSALSTVMAQKSALSSKAANKGSVTISSPGTTLADLLSRDTGLVARATGHKARGRLPSGSLELERLRDASHGLDADLASAVECMEFHPSVRAKILMTASRDRRVRLFQIDGSSNPLLQTLHVPSLPITTAAFHPMGSSILLTGPRPYLYSYDLQAGRVLRSSPWRAASGSGRLSDEDYKERDLSRARFQPPDGSGSSRLLAIAGRRGAVHLLDWSMTGGAGGSLVGSLRQNSAVVGLDWDSSPGADGRRLVSLSQEGSISIWDVRNSKCEMVKRDVGLFGAKNLRLSPDGHWCSVGSESGIVNMYSMERLLSGGIPSGDSSDNLVEANVEANKAIGNLTTATTTMRYNHDGQILAFASQNKKDALRMLHLPSLTVFSNWPTSGTPLGHVSDVAFSTHGSQYVAIGNTRGRVLLYGLRHFTS